MAQRAFADLAAAPDRATIQRKCAPCEAKEKAAIQTKRAPSANAEAPANAEAALDAADRKWDLTEAAERKIQRLATTSLPRITPDSIFRSATRGPGQAIPHQQAMETAFGERFHDVHAYLGRTKEMTSIGAEAAARSGRVAFRDTNPSRETVAHELVHVVQERRLGGASRSGEARLSRPDEPAEREATRLAAHVAEGRGVQVEQAAGGRIQRQATAASPGKPESKASGTPPEMPSEILAAVAEMLKRSEGETEDSSLSRVGQMAVQLLGPAGVIALARKAGVRGAERREQELESQSGGTIHRQAGEAAAGVAGTMWWLTLVDGPLPIGDIVYGALIVGAALLASRAVRQCRCTIRYAPPEIMADCPPRVYGTGITIGDCQNVAKFTAPQKCRQYYGHCGFTQ